MRIAFAIVVFIHALIHLMGVVQAFGWASMEQLSGKTLIPLEGLAVKGAGFLWLLACLLLLAGGVAFLGNRDWWWIPGLTGVVISQVLVILYWQDAKAGSLANIIILLVALVAWGNWKFNRMVDRELVPFRSAEISSSQIVKPAMLEGLPVPVRNWLAHANVVGKEMTHRVHLVQGGEMRIKPDGKWMPVNAEQYFNIDQPGFYWIAKVRGNAFMSFLGRDRYFDGHGNMLIRVLGLFPVVNATGDRIDQGTMLRYLAEIVWFPSAALSPAITWEPVDSLSARAILADGDRTVSGLFRFTPEGDVERFETKRYYDRKEGATLEDWVISIDPDGYRDFAGIRIPAKSIVTWKLDTGDYPWFHVEIRDIRYNQSLKD